jgi:glutamate-ammonia-ligase adenylyltransferase
MPLGRLYDIDTRLRPSGNVGPVACSLTNFARYQRESAQTWEHQAMTRARVVAGDRELAARVEAVVDETVRQMRDPFALAREVGAMRERIFREHGDDDIWHLKHARGGLLEAEFLAQFLQLRFAPEEPTIRTTSAIETFERAAAIGAVSLEDSRRLVRAVRLYQRLQAVLRLSVKDRFVAAAAPPGLQDALVRAAAPGQGVHESRLDFEGLQQELAASQAAVRRIFARFFELQDDPSRPRDPGA